jgi:hypothetical protein
VVIRGLRVGDSSFDVMLRQCRGDVSANVLERLGKGPLKLLVDPLRGVQAYVAR